MTEWTAEATERFAKSSGMSLDEARDHLERYERLRFDSPHTGPIKGYENDYGMQRGMALHDAVEAFKAAAPAMFDQMKTTGKGPEVRLRCPQRHDLVRVHVGVHRTAPGDESAFWQLHFAGAPGRVVDTSPNGYTDGQRRCGYRAEDRTECQAAFTPEVFGQTACAEHGAVLAEPEAVTALERVSFQCPRCREKSADWNIVLHGGRLLGQYLATVAKGRKSLVIGETEHRPR